MPILLLLLLLLLIRVVMTGAWEQMMKAK